MIGNKVIASAALIYSGVVYVSSALGQTTIGFISDACPRDYLAGEAPLTDDLNQFPVQIPAGWSLDCIVTLGDMPYISREGAQSFDHAFTASAVGTVPVFYAVGNHNIEDNAYDMPVLREKYSSYPAWNKRAGPPNCAETTYSFDAGDIHVAVINEYFDGASDTGTDGDVGDELFVWLKQDLRNSDKACKIVCAHEPAFPWRRHIGDSLDEYPEHRDRFWSLLQTEGVAAFVHGHIHYSRIEEYVGVYQVDDGASGLEAPGALTYFHHGVGGYIIHQSSEPIEGGWASAATITRTAEDLNCRVMVNTGEGAGTRMRYFVDYTALDQSPDPDWSANNGGRWWEPAFDDAAAGWNDGELSAGYDSEAGWPWTNTAIDSRNGIHAVFQRIPFVAPSKGEYQLLTIEADYDDALIVWLNGTPIFISENAPSVGEGDFWNKLATFPRDAGGDQAHAPAFVVIDATQHMDLLNEGVNLLAAGNWNCATDSHDLAAGVRLSLKYHPLPLPILVSFQPAAAQTRGFIPASAEAFGTAYPFGWK